MQQLEQWEDCLLRKVSQERRELMGGKELSMSSCLWKGELCCVIQVHGAASFFFVVQLTLDIS